METPRIASSSHTEMVGIRGIIPAPKPLLCTNSKSSLLLIYGNKSDSYAQIPVVCLAIKFAGIDGFGPKNQCVIIPRAIL